MSVLEIKATMIVSVVADSETTAAVLAKIMRNLLLNQNILKTLLKKIRHSF